MMKMSDVGKPLSPEQQRRFMELMMDTTITVEPEWRCMMCGHTMERLADGSAVHICVNQECANGRSSNVLVDVVKCLSAWSELKWRHHSTGLLQAYLPNDGGVRIHIWNRGLKMRNSGEMHNHRFDLQSHVLVGSLTHTRLALTPDEESGTHSIWDIPGASQGSNDTLRLHDQTSVRGSRVNMEMVDERRFTEGDSYIVRKWEFHWARQEPDDDELTVTLVRLHNKETERPASLLYPFGHQPTHAFTDDTKTERQAVRDAALTTSLVQDARLHLEKLTGLSRRR